MGLSSIYFAGGKTIWYRCIFQGTYNTNSVVPKLKEGYICLCFTRKLKSPWGKTVFNMQLPTDWSYVPIWSVHIASISFKLQQATQAWLNGDDVIHYTFNGWNSIDEKKPLFAKNSRQQSNIKTTKSTLSHEIKLLRAALFNCIGNSFFTVSFCCHVQYRCVCERYGMDCLSSTG